MDEQHLRSMRETYAMAKPYIQRGTVGIDVGCREGGFSAQMEEDFQHIFAFDFRNKIKEFQNNVKDITKFTYTVCGIGEQNGHSFTTSNKVGRIKDNGNVKVPIKTLDSFNYENVGFIKYDIEGYELRAIKGSEKTIKKYFPVIVVEQNKGNLDAVELLKEWGYECKGIDKMMNMDYLMVKNV
jgi:FkbM family methyltransferase